MRARALIILLCLLMAGCGDAPLNSPYKSDKVSKKVLFTSFSEQPKTFDSAKSYSSDEYVFLNQIYEPPITYDYLKRPYQIKPLTLAELPKVFVFKDQGTLYSRYVLDVQKGLRYQPHPAFARNERNQLVYLPLLPSYLEDNDINTLSDFKQVGSREVTADDFIYQIKRLADPANHSPIGSLMAEHIVGFKEFAAKLKQMRQENQAVDIRKIELTGIKKLDPYHYQITIYNEYPQFIYWLAMPFFAPMPWEVVQFYDQEGMSDRNISLDWYPVGTGPFMLTDNNPNRRMIMVKNPNYRTVLFPSTGSKEDKANGYLKYAGKRLPLIDEIYFSLEKESIPRWTKFLQGYYDFSGVGNDSFDQAISISADGKPSLTEAMQQKGILLESSVQPSISYMGFNMLDDVIGGRSKKARKLRQAISIAINYEEYISIFLNGRGQVAQGPIPPGISGYQEGLKGLNPYVYQWQDNKLARRSIADAKKLMVEAGYPKGRDLQTGKPLILNYDVTGGSGPEEKAYFDWLRKQFRTIGISLNIRATQYNRFQQKLRDGNAQIFSLGWNADYPDPENFLFLFLSSNGKVKHHGENATNYDNKKFDKLFLAMRQMPDGPKRDILIAKMISLLQKDAPWIFGFFPKLLSLQQAWTNPTKPMPIGTGALRYVDVDPAMRVLKQEQWNTVVVWPLVVLCLLLALTALPVCIAYYKRIHKAPKRYKDKLC